MDPKKNRYILSFTLAALVTGAAIGFRTLAQSTNLARNTAATNVMAGYAEAARNALVSGTEATNLTDAEVGRLLNESIKTNLAAQLWFRQAMGGTLSSHGAKMATELRVLESLRAGRTNDAIRELEDSLDGDIILLSMNLQASDQTHFKPTPQSRTALQWARDYREKFPYKSGNSATDNQVKDGLSYLDQK
jgi:hypothetical protein